MQMKDQVKVVQSINLFFRIMNAVPVEQFTENIVQTDITKSNDASDHNINSSYETKVATYTLFKAKGVGNSYKVSKGNYVLPLNGFTLDDFIAV